jgi:uncharacterized iron-regulated membrane protein
MNAWQRWVRAPGTLLFRRVLFQIHLWLGIGVGLYILMISVSGSAIVLRPQISRWFIPADVPSMEGVAMTGAELEAKVIETYRNYEFLFLVEARREGRATYVELQQDGAIENRYFDQYTGKDLGSTFPWQVATVEWLTDLHDELLMGREGRRLNGWGGILFMLMTLSGLVIWWQGSRRWKDGLVIKKTSPRGFNWQLHSFLGFWSLILMFAWGITAIYFAWPAMFDYVIDWLDDDLYDADRPDDILLFLIRLHFGRFRDMLWANFLWVALGLLPAIMFITGFILWYKRVVKRWLGP